MTRHPFKTERAAAIHMARVYLAQARCARYRHQPAAVAHQVNVFTTHHRKYIS